MADDTPREHRITSDRDTIQEWADEHGMLPVRSTGGERDISFVPRSEAEERGAMDWDEFHTALEESDYVVVHDRSSEEAPLGVHERDRAIQRTEMDAEEIEQSLMEGDVVTSEVTETRVVETTVVERAELESELVDTDIVDERVVDVELESRECTNCDLVAMEGTDATDWFDADHYLGSRTDEGTMTGPGVDVGMAPYRAELDVEDYYRVTRELTERFTIETRVADTDVTEMDTIASDDVDVEGLHQSIVESDLFRTEETGESHVVSEEDLETEFVEGDRIHTYVDRKMTVEDEVLDRKHLTTEISEVADHEIEVVGSTGTGATTTSEMGTTERTIEHGGAAMGMTTGAEMDETTSGEMDETTGAEMDETAAGERPMDAMADEPTPESTAEEHTTGAGPEETAPSRMDAEAGEYRTDLTESDEGKDVVDASGEEVGMVVEVDEPEGIAHVDPHPGLTDRIKAKLDMGEADDESYRLREEQISRITDDHVEIEGGPEIPEDETS